MESNRICGRDVALAAGAFAVGVLGSRLLAPLLAAGQGSLRSRMGADPFDRLIDDHRQILSTLREMESVSTDSPLTRGKVFLTVKRKRAEHAMAEEGIGYPLFHDEADGREDSKHLYDEHADIKIHLFELEMLLKSNEDWSSRVRSLRELIEHHVRDEEDVQFPKLKASLEERKVSRLPAQIRREEAMVL